MRMRSRTGRMMLAAVVAGVLGIGNGARAADRLVMHNADVLQGTIVGVRNGSLLLRTAYAGIIPIRMTEISEIETGAPVQVALKDKTTYTVMLRKDSARTVRLISSNPSFERSVYLDQIESIGIEPPSESFLVTDTVQFADPQPENTELPVEIEAPTLVDTHVPTNSAEAAVPDSANELDETADSTTKSAKKKDDWRGYITAGLSFVSGNTEKETANGTIQMERDARPNRQAIKARYSSSEESGEMTERKGYLSLKADHFIRPHQYVYAMEELKYDQFKDLDLSTATGAGYGVEVWKDKRKSLDVELGGAYLHERYEDAADESRLAPRTAAKVGYNMTRRVELKNALVAFPSLDGGDYEYYNEATVHFKMDQHWGFNVVNIYEFDSDPADSNKKTDATTSMGVRYSF